MCVRGVIPQPFLFRRGPRGYILRPSDDRIGGSEAVGRGLYLIIAVLVVILLIVLALSFVT
jgi:hypothetical protein